MSKNNIHAPGGGVGKEDRNELLGHRVRMGRSFHSLQDGDNEMKSDARKCTEQLGRTRVGWLTWFNNFCSTESAMKAQ